MEDIPIEEVQAAYENVPEADRDATTSIVDAITPTVEALDMNLGDLGL